MPGRQSPGHGKVEKSRRAKTMGKILQAGSHLANIRQLFLMVHVAFYRKGAENDFGASGFKCCKCPHSVGRFFPEPSHSRPASRIELQSLPITLGASILIVAKAHTVLVTFWVLSCTTSQSYRASIAVSKIGALLVWILAKLHAVYINLYHSTEVLLGPL